MTIRHLSGGLGQQAANDPLDDAQRSSTYHYLLGCNLSSAFRRYLTSCLPELAAEQTAETMLEGNR